MACMAPGLWKNQGAYTVWSHNGVLSILSLPPQSTYMYKPINTAREREDGEWVSQLQQPAATS